MGSTKKLVILLPLGFQFERSHTATMKVLLIVNALFLVQQVSSFGLLTPAGSGRRTALIVTRRWESESSSDKLQEPEPEAAPIGPEWETKWKVDDSFTTTESGLKFKDIVEGDGEMPEDEGAVSLFYKFHFDDFSDVKSTDEGMLYFDSRARNPNMEPMTFQYGKAEIIKGWMDGMATMKAGGKRILIIPPELGYGDKGIPAIGRAPNQLPAIPGNSCLKFEITLESVDNSPLTKFRYKVPKPSSIFEKRWF